MPTYERDHLPLSMSNSQRKKRKAEIFNELRDYKKNVRPPIAPEHPSSGNRKSVNTANLMGILALTQRVK